jgi:hypothetical protein
MFCKENRDQVKADNPEMDGKDITRALAEQWALVKEDSDALSKYQTMANEANEGFEERMSDYNGSPSTPKGKGKKLSESEQKKADDPEHYELNTKTGRYQLKKTNKAPSPKATTPKTKKAEKKVEKAEKKPEKKPEEDDDLLG